MTTVEHKPGMWGGRFEGQADALFRAINDSLPVDWRLVQQDIRGSVVWAQALGRAGVLDAVEVSSIVETLEEIGQKATALTAPPVESGAEDVHTWVEDSLVERLGTLGKKLHTGRSRNDQVATDLRLWAMETLDRLRDRIYSVLTGLADLGERNIEVIMPGYTHLQRAQPVLFAHWCLAYFEMFQRDLVRMEHARRAAARCPLGCGALAGTAYPVDRAWIAAELGFEGPCMNSLDAVSDRDFVLDVLSAAGACSMHLSRMAEDLIVYASQEFGFVELDDGVASGSSLMPQKKNPDGLELMRGKCGRIGSAYGAMLMTLKGLPLAYNKDMQEDKALLFGTLDDLGLCLAIAGRVLSGLTVDSTRCRAAAAKGGILATELADYLVSRGTAFRDAHEQVGRLVRLAEGQGVELGDLDIATIREQAPMAGDDAGDWLTLEGALERRDCSGGTSLGQVHAALDRAREFVKPNIGGHSAPIEVQP